MFSLTLTNDHEIEQGFPKFKSSSQVLNGALQSHYRQYVYPHDVNEPPTVAVTKLQQIQDDHYLSLDVPDTTTQMAASDKGTLVHLLLSYLSFQDDDVSQLIQQLYDENLIDEQGKAILEDYQDKIQGFINSPYYTMIQNATHIYKEKSFSYYDKEKDIIVHGIFDLVFVSEDQIYVLDYKTDRVASNNSDEALTQKHFVQLNYYQKVLKDMYQKDIHAIVYYLHISKGVEF